MRRTTFTRVFTIATAVLLLVGVMTPSPALARAGCASGPLAGTADVTTEQFITAIANSTDLRDDVRLTNLGPCNVPAASLNVTLPTGAIYVGFSSNPSAWTCTDPTVPPSVPTGPITCSEQNTIGVPGTADIFIRYNAGTGSGTPVIACGSGGTDAALCPTPAPGTPPDAFPGNNLSYAGLLAPGGSLIYGPGGSATPTGNFDHTTTVTLSQGGLVNIYQATVCPPEVLDCFLGTITINTTAGGPKTWTLSFLASIATKSLAQITVWNNTGSGFTQLTSCNGKHATDPCISDRLRSTNIFGDTVYTIIVQGTQDDSMTAD